MAELASLALNAVLGGMFGGGGSTSPTPQTTPSSVSNTAGGYTGGLSYPYLADLSGIQSATDLVNQPLSGGTPGTDPNDPSSTDPSQQFSGDWSQFAAQNPAAAAVAQGGQDSGGGYGADTSDQGPAGLTPASDAPTMNTNDPMAKSPPATSDAINAGLKGGQQGQQGGPQPWGDPYQYSVKQPPPGYQRVPESQVPPNLSGVQLPGQPGQPAPPQSQQGAPDVGGAQGGGRMPQMGPVPQGIGGVGNLGGAAGMPLPMLIQMMMQQIMARRRRGMPMGPMMGMPGMMRGPMSRSPFGPVSRASPMMGARQYPTPGSAPFSPQSKRDFWDRNINPSTGRPFGAEGGASVHPGPNYMQRLHQGQYPPLESEMRTLQTPYGMGKFNPEAAGDFNGFLGDLRRSGFPMQGIGSYNRRRMRWANNWSSHAWGTAMDMNDSDGPLSGPIQQWMAMHPGLFQQIMRNWHMSQPLPTQDPNHIEWTGPGQGNQPPPTNNFPPGNYAKSDPPQSRPTPSSWHGPLQPGEVEM